jgi:hypothetical protein
VRDNPGEHGLGLRLLNKEFAAVRGFSQDNRDRPKKVLARIFIEYSSGICKHENNGILGYPYFRQ